MQVVRIRPWAGLAAETPRAFPGRCPLTPLSSAWGPKVKGRMPGHTQSSACCISVAMMPWYCDAERKDISSSLLSDCVGCHTVITWAISDMHVMTVIYLH